MNARMTQVHAVIHTVKTMLLKTLIYRWGKTPISVGQDAFPKLVEKPVCGGWDVLRWVGVYVTCYGPGFFYISDVGMGLNDYQHPQC